MNAAEAAGAHLRQRAQVMARSEGAVQGGDSLVTCIMLRIML